MIKINQIGYELHEDKKFFVNSSEQKLDKFQVLNCDNQVVYEGELSGPCTDSDTGDTVYKGDFSDLEQRGNFCIVVSDFKSQQFEIEENIYSEIRDALLKAMYYQRCGIELTEEYASYWQHGSCHEDDAYLYEEPKVHIDTTGGWHDAGDYGKYVVPAAKTVADLLLAYQFFPKAFSDDLGIPESGNGIPDLLDEVRVALNWMFKMQHKDGAVYHKVTSKNFIGMEMPENSDVKRFILPISSTATADFAAVMARAARVYQSFDQDFARKALQGAENAGNWLLENPELKEFKNPSDVKTGEYGDGDDTDERFWATAELFRSTGDEKYHQVIKEKYNQQFSKTAIDWQHVGGYGTITYLLLEKSRRDEEIYHHLEDEFDQGVKEFLNRADQNGYGITLGNYIWGSNGVLMDQALILIMADIINEEDQNKYINIAQNNFNYLLGTNALDQCFVTGFGSNPIKNPHHRPSSADGIEKPVPGLVSGGPNQNLQDETLRQAVSPDTPPARAFVDAEGSHSANEITTYWNSPAVFTAAYFSSQENNIC